MGKDDFELNLLPGGKCYYDMFDNDIKCTHTGENCHFWIDGGHTYHQDEYSLNMSSGNTETDYLSVRCVKD